MKPRHGLYLTIHHPFQVKNRVGKHCLTFLFSAFSGHNVVLGGYIQPETKQYN